MCICKYWQYEIMGRKFAKLLGVNIDTELNFEFNEKNLCKIQEEKFVFCRELQNIYQRARERS